MDRISLALMDIIQRSFPLSSRPYEQLAERVGVSSGEVRQRLARFKEEGQLRQISAIFNTGAIGYHSSLAALAVPEERVEEAAAALNHYPGVSHNYLRPGQYYNIWFTLAVPPWESLEDVARQLTIDAGGWPLLVLPAVKKYKLEVVLDLLDEAESDDPPPDTGIPRLEGASAFDASPENIRIVRCIQEDLPLVEEPFAVWGEILGMDGDELIGLIREWIGQGFIRRFAAVLNHRRVGFHANGIVVWHAPEDRIDEYGAVLAGRPEVSHCYHRPAYPEWPYNLYAMIHGRSTDECQAIAARLAEAAGLPDYRILFSTREFKKIRLKLFWDEPPLLGESA